MTTPSSYLDNANVDVSRTQKLVETIVATVEETLNQSQNLSDVERIQYGIKFLPYCGISLTQFETAYFGREEGSGEFVARWEDAACIPSGGGGVRVVAILDCMKKLVREKRATFSN